MKNITIGIPTALYGDTFGMNAKYLNWVSQFGQPVLLTPRVSQINDVDALFMPGGADISNNLTFLNTRSNPHLDWFDKEELPKYVNASKPIFGVCRGMQSINVHFGGTLKNLIGEELQMHQKNSSEQEKESKVHSIKFTNYCPFIDFQKTFIKVNSIHHQCVDILGKDLEIIAKSLDNIPEAIMHTHLPIAAVQWHPEKINDDFAIKLFKHILQ